MSRKPKLLVISEFWTPDPGGMAIYAQAIVPRLGKLGYDITLLVPKTAATRDSLDSENVSGKFFWAPEIHFFGRFSILPAVLFQTPISKFSAIVDIAVSPYGAVSSVIARTLGIPHIIGAHGNEVSRIYPELGMSPLFRHYCRYAYQHATKIAANSDFTGELLLPNGVKPSQIRVIPNGVDTTFFTPGTVTEAAQTALGSGRAAPHLLCVGQLKATKGQANLIRAFANLVVQFPEAKLDLVGSGPSEQEYHELAKSLGLENQVRFLGHRNREELRTLYRAADITVIPTPKDFRHAEGFGLAGAEALACGCAVAASNWGGHTSFVREGATGVLFDAAEPQDVASKIAQLYQNTSLRMSIKTTGPALIDREYTWDHSAQGWDRMLQSALASKRLHINL